MPRDALPLSHHPTVPALTCANPFCDGYGAIDISPSINGRAWAPGVCEVGPHPKRSDEGIWPEHRAPAPVQGGQRKP